MFFTANIHNLTLDKAEQKFMSSQSLVEITPFNAVLFSWKVSFSHTFMPTFTVCVKQEAQTVFL